MRSPKLHFQRGQTMVEYLIILPVLLLLVLGVIQFALIYQAKSTLNYATFMGARQGALKNASMFSVMDGVAGGMTPLFMRTTDAAAIQDLAKARIIAAIEIFNPLTAKVEILSPTQEAFDEFMVDGEIPNDNLMYRSSDPGKESGMSIQDANLLKVRVTYCVKLVVPFVDRVIYALATGIKGVQNLANKSYTDSTVEETPNLCSTISSPKASLRREVQSLTDALPAEARKKTIAPLGAQIDEKTKLANQKVANATEQIQNLTSKAQGAVDSACRNAAKALRAGSAPASVITTTKDENGNTITSTGSVSPKADGSASGGCDSVQRSGAGSAFDTINANVEAAADAAKNSVDKTSAEANAVVDTADDIMTNAVTDLSNQANSFMNTIIDKLPSELPSVPWLNWNLNGLRIPITAEAIVRMQSPARPAK
ncbi:MAG: hypothetical protein EBQ58_08380 [Betaproteobacteria bacterium]|nr:hypothetical protein [Betaproteobacteria bacterium]